MCLLSLFFQPKDEPIPIEIAIIVADISISEGVLAEPIPNVKTQGFLPLLRPWGMFPHAKITTLMAEVVLAEEKASIEEEVLEGLGSATGGTSAEATTPLKAVGGGPSLMVSLFSIPSFATEMPDIEMSPNEASGDVPEDSGDEPIVKTKVSDFEDLSTGEIDTTVADP
ncbi:hypothetical protein CMV_004677 [Castanea mollissima]|uniref:Uncharacterized protein n=1 Tax=Castanea mollissima TaxID=60419 RepID=A0A8J4RSC1_9ROSI|nr:hypothetical protein CMV_004677 [Castanea mollissima]